MNRNVRIKTNLCLMAAKISAHIELHKSKREDFNISMDVCEGVVNGAHIHTTYFVDVRTLGFVSVADMKGCPGYMEIIKHAVARQAKRMPPKEGV